MHPWLARALLLATSVLVALTMAELLLRVLGIGYGGVHMAPSALLHHEHPRDHRFVSYHRSGEYGGHVVHYDDAGRRADPDQPAGADPSGPVIAFMGDSFVEALQVAHHDSFVGRLQTAAGDGVTVENYGTSSYSPVLYLLQWRHRVAPRHPTVVFLLLFGNDVRDDRQMTAIARRNADGAIVAVAGPRPTWWARLARLSYAGRLARKVHLQLRWRWRHRHDDGAGGHAVFVEENPALTAPTDTYLRHLVQAIRGQETRIVLMAVPSREGVRTGTGAGAAGTFHDTVRRWAGTHDVPFLDLATPFDAAAAEGAQLFFHQDIHFTETGHQVVAEAVLDAYGELFAGRR